MGLVNPKKQISPYSKERSQCSVGILKKNARWCVFKGYRKHMFSSSGLFSFLSEICIPDPCHTFTIWSCAFFWDFPTSSSSLSFHVKGPDRNVMVGSGKHPKCITVKRTLISVGWVFELTPILTDIWEMRDSNRKWWIHQPVLFNGWI